MMWLLTALACAGPPAPDPGSAVAVEPPAAPVPVHAGPAFSLPDAVAVGDCPTVLAKAGRDADGDRLVVGRCLIGTDPAAAIALLEPVKTGVVGEYARLARAHALLAADRPGDAVAALDGLTLPGRAGLDVRLARGRALVQAGRSTEAREDLRALLDTPVGIPARYWLAKGGEDRGEKDAAIATYQRVWADGALGPWAGLAAERLSALGAPVPDVSTADGRALVRDRAKTLGRAGLNDESRKLTELLHETATVTGGTPLELARARFKARDYPGAVEAYRDALGPPATATGGASDLFDYALGTSRTGDYDTAAVIYRRLVDAHPTADQADLASFKIGYLEVDRGRCDDARARLAEHVAARPDSEHLDEALWFSGWCAFKTGDTAAAVKDWDALVAARPKSSLVPGARYWKARARGVQGDAKAEEEGLADVIRRHPVSGYAWFAAARLGRTFERKDRVPRPAWPAALASRTDVQRAEALLALGLRSEALDELRPAKSAASATKDGALAAAHAFIAAGDYKTGKELAKPYCVDPWSGGDPVAQQACTPMPEGTVVASVAAVYGLDALLPYGIMTAESLLDPSVTSIAGARGLMQVMPLEAVRIHEASLGPPAADPDLLYEAPYNAAIGTSELGLKTASLGDCLDGPDLPAVVASYNGGEDAVRRWLAASESPPEFDRFSEDIGYTETRQYVKRVLGFTMAYRWVYGDE